MPHKYYTCRRLKKAALQGAKLVRLGMRFSVVLALCVLVPSTSVFAQDPSINYDIKCTTELECPRYDPNDCSATAAIGEVPGASSGIWNSGLQPPYILEQFMIETLKAIAAKKGVDPSNAVTQEHVIALVAFALGEGGDINNRWLFNPLNTGLNAPELIDGAQADDGTQSFKSFDAGVEATARVMVAKNQSRLGEVLTQKDSSAAQFMEALTFFDRYPGNKFWAAASLPPNTEKYFRQRLALVQQVRAQYEDIAATVIGTPAFEQIENITDKSKLQFHPAGSNPSEITLLSNSSATCGAANGAGVVGGDIVQTGRGLAWPSINASHIVRAGQADGGKAQATPAYQEALPKYNGSKGLAEYSDCGVFVATVMVASNADPDYPRRGTSVQRPYVENSSKYAIIPNPHSTADLEAGDILIKYGHTYIYTGPYTGDDGRQYNSVAASLAASSTGHTPEAENWYFESGYVAARLTK